MRLPADQLESMLADFEAEGLTLVEVDVAAARGALAEAVAANVSTRHAIPPEYELWAPLYHESDPPPADEPVAEEGPREIGPGTWEAPPVRDAAAPALVAADIAAPPVTARPTETVMPAHSSERRGSQGCAAPQRHTLPEQLSLM